eukprot:tig00000215_g18617.t1
MFTMPAGHGLGSGRGLFQAIAGAASVVRRFALAIAPEYSELLQVRRTSQRQRLQSCFKFVAPANANACIQAGERRLPPRLRSHGEQGLVFRRLQMLIRGGCSRTSLETAKLLLALDPDSDLMGVLQCIDYFALRAREYKFLLELVAAPALPGRSASFVREPPLSRREPPLFLPIALNSSAYALMRVARDGGAAPVDEPAVLMYPGAVRPLLENYNVKPDSGGARGWAALHRRPLFDDDEPAASVELPPLTAGIGPWTSSML